MLYRAGIRTSDEKKYVESGDCQQHQFVNWLKRAAWLTNKIGKTCFVDFWHTHTFEVRPSGEKHLLTPEVSMIDPAAALLESGD